MKQEDPSSISIKHCFCDSVGELIQIPISYEPTNSQQYKINTLIDTSDQQEDIRSKFQRYNPNLSHYLTKDAPPIYSKTTRKQKVKEIKKQTEIKKTVKEEILQKKQFQFKKFDYIDKSSSGCYCNKKKFTKFVWKPIYSSGFYTGKIPEYKLDDNGQYVPQTKRKQDQIKIQQKVIQKVDANVQTNKQIKPAVSFGDISQVKPPTIKPPITNIIPKQFEQPPSKDKVPIDPTSKNQRSKQQINRHQQTIYQNNNQFRPIQKVKYAQPSVFQQFQQGKIHNIIKQQQSGQCDCSCHYKICHCSSKIKKQLLQQASNDPYFAQRLISKGKSNICQCLLLECHCECPLKHYQLPQYRLNPQNYRNLPVNQINEIPYAGKMRRYDFNGC